MIFKKLQFLIALLAINCGALYGGSLRDGRSILPVSLWAQVAVVPPGSNDTRLPATQPGTPEPSPPANPPATSVPREVPAVSVPNEPTGQTPAVTGVAPGTSGTPTPVVRTPPPAQEQPGPPALPPNCTATVAAKEIPIGHQGGQVRFTPVFSRSGCATEPSTSEMWIQRVEGESKDGAYLFNIQPNTTRSPRKGSIFVGTAISVVNQAAGKFASFAAAPSRIESSAADRKHTIAAWSDQSDLVLEAATSTSWLKVIPASGGKNAGAREFTIEVAPAEMKPGRHQGSVEITAPGTVNDPIRIPIIITVPEKK